MKRLFLVLALALGACVVSDYARDLDACAFNHMNDPVGRAQCQCDVSRDAGRSCDWIDGGKSGWADGGLDGGAE